MGDMQTIVINNRESLINAQLPHKGKGKDGSIQTGEVVTFIPGANLVDSAKLKTLRENPGFEALFKTKIESSPAPEQNPEKVGKCVLVLGKEVEDTSPLAKLAEKAAEALIAETFSVPQLDGWIKEEGRPEIRRLLEAQRSKLSAGSTGGPAAAR